MKTSNVEEKLEILILGELNPPKNRRIRRRNQGITKRGSRGAHTVVLENQEKWGWRGMSYPQVGLNLSKLDCPVFQTGLSGFARIGKTHPLKLKPFKRDLISLMDLRPLKGGVENHFRVIAHKG
jgi:hypothetical protein